MADLASVRRLEAVAFRAWPAASTQYDGSWLIRLTEGHPSKRLNSVTPLDPSDTRDIAARLEKAGRHFAECGRPLRVRLAPTAPRATTPGAALVLAVARQAVRADVADRCFHWIRL